MTLRRLAGDTLIYGSGYILGRVLYYLVTLYLTWKFEGEQEQYGIFTELYFYVAVLLIILTLRMETTFFRFASRDGTRTKAFGQAATLLMGTSVVWVVILLLSRGNMASALGYPGYISHVTVLGFIVALDVLVAIPFASLRLEQRPVRFASLKIIGTLINIATVLFLLEALPRLAANDVTWATSIYDPADRLLYVFIANLMGSLFLFLVFVPKYLRIPWQVDMAYLRRMLRYTLPLVLVGVAGVINQSGYIVLLKEILPGDIMQNLSDGGVYAAAMRIAILMSLFTTAFNYAAEPFFFNESRQANARETYAEVAKAFTVAGCVIMVGILMYLDVIQLLLGRSFRSALYLVPVLLLAFFFLGLYYNFSIWYKLDDKTHFGAYISGGGVFVTIAASVLLIPELGKAGSAWSALACYGFMASTCYLLGRKYFPIPYDLRAIGTLVFVSALAWGISSVIASAFEPGLAGRLTINSLIMLAFIATVFALEKKLILSVIRRNA